MEENAYKFYVRSLILLLVYCVVFAGSMHCPPSVSMQCGGGNRCAMVRTGRGPPVPECVTIEEAMLLAEASRGAHVGPGNGLGPPHRRFRMRPFRRRPFLRRGHRFPIAPHPLGQRPLIIAGTKSAAMPGIIHLPDGNHVHVPVVPNSVRDDSERIHLNLTIHNENNNVHDQRGSGNVRVSQATATRGSSSCTPCGPDGSCPVPLICMYTEGCPENLGCRAMP